MVAPGCRWSSTSSGQVQWASWLTEARGRSDIPGSPVTFHRRRRPVSWPFTATPRSPCPAPPVPKREHASLATAQRSRARNSGGPQPVSRSMTLCCRTFPTRACVCVRVHLRWLGNSVSVCVMSPLSPLLGPLWHGLLLTLPYQQQCHGQCHGVESLPTRAAACRRASGERESPRRWSASCPR